MNDKADGLAKVGSYMPKRGSLKTDGNEMDLTTQENIPPAKDSPMDETYVVMDILPPEAHIPRCVVIKLNEIPPNDQLL